MAVTSAACCRLLTAAVFTVPCACSNLAGHQTVTGDLPPEWYNQTAFPNLFYLKLKGTQIRPNMLGLTWTGERTE